MWSICITVLPVAELTTVNPHNSQRSPRVCNRYLFTKDFVSLGKPVEVERPIVQSLSPDSHNLTLRSYAVSFILSDELFLGAGPVRRIPLDMASS